MTKKQAEREVRIAQSELDRFVNSVFVEPIRRAELERKLNAAEAHLSEAEFSSAFIPNKYGEYA